MAFDRPLVTAIRTGLAELGDRERAVGQQAYMKSSMPYRGVMTSPLRSLCRAVFAEHVLPDRATWEATVRELWDRAAFREERYAATELSGDRRYGAYQDVSALPLYEHLVVTGAWWDHVDVVAIHRIGPILRAAPDVVAPMLRAWSVDADMWRRRTSIIAQVASKGATDTELLADCIDPNVGDREFFIRKAIGWALREHAKTDAAWVRQYLDENGARLSGLSRREAAKHLG